MLTKIALSRNTIKDEGAVALGEALKTNKTLKELELGFCGIGPEGGKALAAALSEGSAVLTKLDVQQNELGDEGKKALQNAAKGRKGFNLILHYAFGIQA